MGLKVVHFAMFLLGLSGWQAQLSAQPPETPDEKPPFPVLVV